MIREIRGADAEAYAKLRREALLDAPLAFASAPDDDIASSAEKVRQLLANGQGSVILGAFQPDLVGTAGLYLDPHLKSCHKAHLWGMYVAPGHRRQGIGARLLEAILRHAVMLPGMDWVHLSVTDAAPEARQLYEGAGFRVWGSEPDSLRHAGQAVTSTTWRCGSSRCGQPTLATASISTRAPRGRRETSTATRAG